MIKEYKLQLPSKTRSGNVLKISEILNFERFIRLNPYWVVKSLEFDGSNFRLDLRDHETEEEFVLNGQLNSSANALYSVSFEDNIFNGVSLIQKGNEIVAEVSYSTKEVEESLETKIVFWLRSIQAYLRLYLKKTPYTLFYRILMNKMVLTMTPSQRKICLMLYRVTLLEILAIVLIVVGYFLFVPQ